LLRNSNLTKNRQITKKEMIGKRDLLIIPTEENSFPF
jgi:hypothetical protein